MNTTPTTTENLWWTTVAFGGNPAPRGPWSSYEDAVAAVDRWARRLGADAGSLIATHSLRLHAYRTRAAARAADISDAPGTHGCVAIRSL